MQKKKTLISRTSCIDELMSSKRTTEKPTPPNKKKQRKKVTLSFRAEIFESSFLFAPNYYGK